MKQFAKIFNLTGELALLIGAGFFSFIFLVRAISLVVAGKFFALNNLLLFFTLWLFTFVYRAWRKGFRMDKVEEVKDTMKGAFNLRELLYFFYVIAAVFLATLVLSSFGARLPWGLEELFLGVQDMFYRAFLVKLIMYSIVVVAGLAFINSLTVLSLDQYSDFVQRVDMFRNMKENMFGSSLLFAMFFAVFFTVFLFVYFYLGNYLAAFTELINQTLAIVEPFVVLSPTLYYFYALLGGENILESMYTGTFEVVHPE